ncbi:putative ferric-chelate reductase 1 homolog [Pollicipes pollicipes]|uniref:putative ferric-chelate reductase 1 homolog n=1 Tax=Pollicipes pollicipes TaxID=41117 RepID=UPI001885A04A|nr:putative ferric-chelate reductase 1 homolog [Pollicipes pollicipes]
MGLMAKRDGRYAAVGISSDTEMGSDGVIFCTNVEGSQPVIYYGYNDGKSSAYKSGQNPAAASNRKVWEQDGHFMCSFTQPLSLEIPGESALNLAEKHHLLVSTGSIGDSSEPRYHGSDKIASSEPVDLTDNSALTSAGVPRLIKAHGSLMLVAWVGTAGIGILSAQHLRLTWVGKQIFGKDVWFTIHRAMMVLTALCTWTGFALIVTHLKTLSFGHPHNILGFIVFLISVVQVAGALLRPSPEARLRPLFAWGHRLGGLAAYLLSLVALFLARQLPQLDLPRYWLWLLTGAIALDVVVSLVFMAIHHCVGDSRVDPDVGSPSKHEAPGSSLRKILLAIYIFFSAAFVVAMVTTLALSDA